MAAVLCSRFPVAPLDGPAFDPEPLRRAVAAQASAAYADAAVAAVAPHVDLDHYRAIYPDIAVTELDPVQHFHDAGWREGRDPNTWFDTKYYLAANPDIAAADIDPLLHFVSHGQAEGRRPSRPGGALRAVVDRAMPPADRVRGNDAPLGAAVVAPEALAEALATACIGVRGLVLSVSHDRYIDITGGIQIFIADEQMLFNGDRFAYLHVAPEVARLTLADPADGPVRLQLVLDGRFLGLADPADVVAAVASLPVETAPRRLMAVHSLFGHSPDDLVALAGALRAGRHFFWLHDYASICEGYNLLRDDAVFCNAPPMHSMPCRICVYGASRPGYRARVHALFEAIGFHVLAPSPAALALWQRAADLPHRSARVHANGRLLPLPARGFEPTPLTRPIRIAFVGYPMPHKGWPLFLDLFRACRDLGIYRFHQFAAADSLQPMDGLVCIPVQVDRYDRFAMVAALAEAAIDFVVLLSPWPETFSYVLHEALAAGADAVTLADSGNVADAVRRTGRGVVLRDADALLAFFADLHAVAYARARAAAPPARAALHVCGTTATVDLAGADGPDPQRFETVDPDLVVIAGSRVLVGERDADRHVFTLPAGTEAVRLISRWSVPGIVRPGSADHRRLGVAVSRLRLDDAIVPPGDPRRGAGWHGGGLGAEAWEWTSGDAALAVGGATRLEVTLERLITYVRVPESAG